MADKRNEEEPELFTGVYDEDVVQSKDKKKIGIVIKTAQGDDSSDTDDSSSDEEEKVEKGKVMVGWYTSHSKWSDPDEVRVVNEASVELLDRSLLPGDVVKWVNKSRGNQKGQVVNVVVYADVRIVGTSHILKNVNATQLLPLRKFGLFVPVVKTPWFGIIRDMDEELTLRLKNGSRCVISGDNIESLSDVTDQREEDSTFYCDFFYPGQQVQGPARVFKDATWIVGSRPAINNQVRLKAIVENISLNSVNVDWQVCGFTGETENSLLQPETVLNKDEINSDLKILTHDNEAHLQIGDKVYYILTAADVKQCKENTQRKDKKEESHGKKTAQQGAAAATANVSDDEDDDDSDYEAESSHRATVGPLPRRGGSRSRRRRHVHISKKKKRYQPPQVIEEGEKVCVEVCCTRTVADTVWQNGDEHDNIVSVELYPVIHLDELEFFPGDFVIDKRADNSQVERFGVVQTADFAARLCNIKWLSYKNNATETIEELEENVSVYDIADHQDYAFRAGDIVVRLAGNDNENSDVVAPAGQVIKVNENGTVKVLWVDNTLSSVLPSQLYVVDKEEEEDMDWDDNDDATSHHDDDEWETASDGSDALPSEELRHQLNPLEDIIMRSLAALNTSTTNNSAQSDSSHVVGMNQRTADFITALGQNFTPMPNTDEADLSCHEQGATMNTGAVSTTKLDDNENITVDTLFNNLRTAVDPNSQMLEVLETLEHEFKKDILNHDELHDTQYIIQKIIQKTRELVNKSQQVNHSTVILPHEVVKTIEETLSSMLNNKKLTCSQNECETKTEAAPLLKESDVSPPLNQDHAQDTVTVIKQATTEEREDVVCEETPSCDINSFMTTEQAPTYHKFYSQVQVPSNVRSFNVALMKDIRLLKTHLPPGILVRAFENRMDLFSVLISGPLGTPYEDGLFYFDIQLPENYPAAPPHVHYHAYCAARLNPNLYEEGKVCVSLLGTWSGKGNETWTSKSTIHQVLLSIQSLILCEEPYYNEAGYEKHRGSPEGSENSRMYNEMAVIKMMQSIHSMISRPPEIFKDEIAKHFKEHLPKIFERFEAWQRDTDQKTNKKNPAYPLYPLSQGFWASVKRILQELKKLHETLLRHAESAES